MTRYNAANNWATVLSSAVNSTQTVIGVTDASDDPTFPFKLTVNSEIMNATAAPSTSSYTVTRGAEGTIAAAHSSGDAVENRLTAEVQNDLWTDVESKLYSSGGTLTGTVNFNGNVAQAPEIRYYTETFSSVAPSTAGVLTLNLANGNVFKVTSTQAITSLAFSNVSTSKTNSFTMSVLSATTGVAFAWQTPYSVCSASTTLTAVSSCGLTGDFASNVQSGDIIDVTGFSTAAAANNSDWRIISATTAFLSVVDSSGLVAETSTGGGTVTRRKDYFVDGETPTAPDPYAPKVYTGYSMDGDRWRIVEAGEF